MNKLSQEVEQNIKAGCEMAVGQSGVLTPNAYVYLPTFNGRQMMLILTNMDPNNVTTVYVYDTATHGYIWGPGQIGMMQQVPVGPQDFQGHTILIQNTGSNANVSYWLYAL